MHKNFNYFVNQDYFGFDVLISQHLCVYEETINFMENRVKQIQNKKSAPLLWFLEYPPLFTVGARSYTFTMKRRNIPLYYAYRGGKITYHGPGQRIIYVMMDIGSHGKDIKKFVRFLEEWIIQTLKNLGISAKRCSSRIGVWINTDKGEKKIAAIGVRVQQWVTSYGISLNVCPDLGYYDSIIPCGLADYGMTSLERAGVAITMHQVDLSFLQTFPSAFQKIMMHPYGVDAS